MCAFTINKRNSLSKTLMQIYQRIANKAPRSIAPDRVKTNFNDLDEILFCTS